MRDRLQLEALAEWVEALTGPDRDVDAAVSEQVYGWKPVRIGPDYDGNNACEVLTATGCLYDGFAYPPRGAIPRYYHCEHYTRDSRDPAFPRDAVRKLLAAEIRSLAARAASPTPSAAEEAA
ncbi:hypothetical protein [Sphingomonas sp.]|uniref:hypothetical protein n=1 Tax=Sphingomonas sp. TaxID=28214 RepID=UPI003B3B0EC5